MPSTKSPNPLSPPLQPVPPLHPLLMLRRRGEPPMAAATTALKRKLSISANDELKEERPAWKTTEARI